MNKENGPVFFIMGVSGSGKSTIGRLLANALDLPFFDGDDYHPPENIRKMASGKALNDKDREKWLVSLNTLARQYVTSGAVIVCSALKAIYRDVLAQSIAQHVSWVLLEGDFEEIQKRLKTRKEHFMPASLLQSQFDTLEKPDSCICVSISQSPEEIVQHIMKYIELK